MITFFGKYFFSFIRNFLWLILGLFFNALWIALFFPFYVKRFIKVKKKINPRILFGTTPIINNKYWAECCSELNVEVKTLMSNFYSINHKSDFDYFYKDVSGLGYKSFLGQLFNPFIIFSHIIFNYDIVVIPASGTCDLGRTLYWRLEALWLKLFCIKTVVIPYGADLYSHSLIIEKSFAYTFNISYPEAVKKDQYIRDRIQYWVRHADFFLPTFQIDGIGRMDSLPFCFFLINIIEWSPKKFYNMADGTNGKVKIVHAPNHRGVKGTEFLVESVKKLINEGLQVELILLEGVPNSKVREVLHNEADILAEQFVAIAYAMSGIEGMASGLPVLANLGNDQYTRLFRRYSYLDECPILSTSIEEIYSNLKLLVTNPKLRKTLGEAGRQYVEKYHSYDCGKEFFQKVINKVYFGYSSNLTTMFHPLYKDSYNNKTSIVKHPLHENKYVIN